MKRFFILALLALVPAAALAEETADYEVHEWGYVCVNVPPGTNLREAFLKELPGNIRVVAVPGSGHTTRLLPVAPDSQVIPDAFPRVNPRSGSPETVPSSPVPGTPVSSPGGTPGEAEPVLPWGIGDPFIWFHAKRPMQVRLTVKLGINKPFCWWPQGLDEGNTITWKKLWIEPMLPSDKRTASFGSGSSVGDQLRSAREVDSAYISTGNKVERFLMYEFMGFNWSGLRIESSSGSLAVRNASDREVKSLFLMPDVLTRNQAYFTPHVDPWTNHAEAGGTGMYSSLVDLRVRLRQELEEAGLNRDEAACMVQAIAGFDAFMNSPGIRAIYMLDPRSIEEISRLEFSPKPSAMKRVWLALVFDAANYEGIGPVVRDSKMFDRVLAAVHDSGADPAEIKETIRRLDSVRRRG